MRSERKISMQLNFLVLCLVTAFFSASVNAATYSVTVQSSSLGDGSVLDNGGDGQGDILKYETANLLLAGDAENAEDTFNGIYRSVMTFALPALAPGEIVGRATLRMRFSSFVNSPLADLELYHLQTTNHDAVVASDYEAPGSHVATVATPSSVAGEYIYLDVTSLVQSDYVGTADYSAFRYQCDNVPYPEGADGDGDTDLYYMYSGESGTSSEPRLVLDIVPDPAVYSVTVQSSGLGDASVRDTVDDGQGDKVIFETADSLRAGDTENAEDTYNAIYKSVMTFPLPALVPGESVGRATLRMRFKDFLNTPLTDLELYHLQTTNHDAVVVSDYEAPGRHVATVATPSSVADEYIYLDVTSLVQSDYANDGVAKYSAFRYQCDNLPYPDGTDGDGDTDLYYMYSGEAGASSEPRLILDIIDPDMYTVPVRSSGLGDSSVRDTGGDGQGDLVIYETSDSLRAGDTENGTDTYNAIYRSVMTFALPGLAPGESVGRATLRMRFKDFLNTPLTDLELYHLQTTNHDAVVASDYEAPGSHVATVATPSSVADEYIYLDVTSLIQSDYAGAADYSAFRYQCDNVPYPAGTDGDGDTDLYYMYSGEAGASSEPRLVLDIVPDPAVYSVTVQSSGLGDSSVRDTVGDGQGDKVIFETADSLRAGDTENGTDTYNAIYRSVMTFPLPALAPGEIVGRATLSLRFKDFLNTPVTDLELYHLQTTNHDAVVASDYEAPGSHVATVATPSSFPDSYIYLDVTSLVQSDYANDGAAEYSAFRYQCDNLPYPAGTDGDGDTDLYYMYSAESGTSSKPELVLDIFVDPPAMATNPSPTDDAADASLDTILSWTAGSRAASHDVYFGTSSPGTFQGNQTGTTFDPGALANDTTYYWRIDEVNAAGTTTGTVWSFTTIATPIVLNPSFEYPDVSGYQYEPTGTDWNHTGTGFIIADQGFYIDEGTGRFPYDGSQILILEEIVSVSQDLSGFMPGHSYQVSWAEADDNNNSIRVSIDSTVLWNGSPLTNNDWVVQTSNSFQATNTTHTLKIEGTNLWSVSGATALVDSIVITEVGATPGPASNPSPANSASNVNVTGTTALSWTSGDNAASHDIYFGTDPTPDAGEFQVNKTGTNYNLGLLSANTTYYWRIDEVNGTEITTGPVWSFTTGAAPTPFTLWQLPPYGDSNHHTMSYVIQTGDSGKVIVVDGGYEEDAPYLKSFLSSLGNHVDMWFITHRHRDHIECLTSILNSPGNVTIGTIYASMPTLSWLQTNDTNAYDETVSFNSALSGAGKSVTEVSLGQVINLDGVSIKIMSVNNPARTTNGDNDQSIAFKLYDGNKTFMFLGDLYIEGGNELLANFGSELDCDYVQMAHHGQQGVGYNVYEAITPTYCFWPTPYWVWEMSTTQEVLGWVNNLGAQGHYYMFNGLQQIQ